MIAKKRKTSLLAIYGEAPPRGNLQESLLFPLPAVLTHLAPLCPPGGALTVARGALSSWWSSLAAPEEATPPAEPALEAAESSGQHDERSESARSPAGSVEGTDLAGKEGETPPPPRPRFEAVEEVEGRPLSTATGT